MLNQCGAISSVSINSPSHLVIKNKSFLVKGFINTEVRYLSKKYHIQLPNLYSREEAIAKRLLKLLKREDVINIIFKDNVNAYKYLCDNLGYRYGEFINEINNLVDDEAEVLKKEYPGFNGFIKYAKDYDSIGYGDVYNYILDFYAENSLGL